MKATRRILSGDFSLDAALHEVCSISRRTDSFKDNLKSAYNQTYEKQLTVHMRGAKTAWEEMKATNAAQQDAYEACLRIASGYDR